jgi:hypothetical protein
VPLSPIGQRHRKSLTDRRGDAVGIVRIYQQRRFAFLSRASETRWAMNMLPRKILMIRVSRPGFLLRA